MNINRITIKDFGPFAGFDVQFSPGLNVILGDNNTGKTYLLKALYAAVATADGENQFRGFAHKLAGVFSLEQVHLSRLVRHRQRFAEVQIERSDGAVLKVVIPSKGKVVVEDEDKWQKSSIKSAYIPTDDVLAHGFLVKDFSDHVFLKKPRSADYSRLLADLEAVIGGKVIAERCHGIVGNERIYINDGKNMRDVALLSEGVRRLALLWLLLRNGSIRPGSVLFWDIPETGLNNKFKRIVASAIAELASDGVQVFVTTNSLFLLRELEIEASSWHYVVRYINLQKAEAGVRVEQEDSPAAIGRIDALEESLLQSDRYMEV